MTPKIYLPVAGLILLLIHTSFAAYPAPSKNQPLQIFILAGQSNAGTHGKLTELPANSIYQNPQSRIGFWHDTSTSWDVIQAQSGSFGPELSAASTLSKALGKDIALIKYSVGATTLGKNPNRRKKDWNVKSENELYQNLLTQISTATGSLAADGIAFEIKGVFWMQGENDAVVTEYADHYQQNLTDFIRTLRRDLGINDLPFFIARLSNSQTKPIMTRRQQIQSAQDAVAASVENTYIFNTDDLTVKADLVHFDTNSLITLGEKFANIYLAKAAPQSNNNILLITASLFLIPLVIIGVLRLFKHKKSTLPKPTPIPKKIPTPTVAILSKRVTILPPSGIKPRPSQPR